MWYIWRIYMTYVDLVKIYKDFLDFRDADDDIFCMRARKVLEAMIENIIVRNEIEIDENNSLFDKLEILEKKI